MIKAQNYLAISLNLTIGLINLSGTLPKNLLNGLLLLVELILLHRKWMH